MPQQPQIRGKDKIIFEEVYLLSVVLYWSVYNNCTINTTTYAVNTINCFIHHQEVSLKCTMFFRFSVGAYPEYTLVATQIYVYTYVSDVIKLLCKNHCHCAWHMYGHANSFPHDVLGSSGCHIGKTVSTCLQPLGATLTALQSKDSQ